MENFSEFELQGTAPQRNFSDIIGHAFNTYVKIIGWSILVTLLTVVVSIIFSAISGPLVGYNALESQAEMEELMRDGSFASGNFVSAMMGIPGYMESILLSTVLSLLMYPVYAGYVNAMHRANTGQNVSGRLFYRVPSEHLAVYHFRFNNGHCNGYRFDAVCYSCIFYHSLLLSGNSVHPF